MLSSVDEEHLRKLLSDTIPLLCKNVYGSECELNIEALIGITFIRPNSPKETVMVSFKESMTADGNMTTYRWSQPASVNLEAEPASSCPENSELSCNQFAEQRDSNDRWGENGADANCRNRKSRSKTKYDSAITQVKVEKDYVIVKDEQEFYPEGADYDIYQDMTENGDSEWSEPANDYGDSEWSGSTNNTPCRSSKTGFQPRKRPLLAKRNNVLPIGSRLGRTISGKVRKQIRNVPPVTDIQPQGQLTESYKSMMENVCDDIMKKSSVLQQFVCHICGVHLCNAPTLKAHVRGTHLSMNQFSCDICHQGFKWYMQLHRHRKRVHADLFPPGNGNAEIDGQFGEEPGYDDMATEQGDGDGYYVE